MTRLRMYTIHVRIWHWVQALSMLALLVTGAAIHWPMSHGPLSFQPMVWLHNAAAAVFLINAFLGLFYYFTSGELWQLIPGRRGMLEQVQLYARYYLGGIFRGEPRPLARTSEARLNPLQRLTYLVILNVLLPFEAVTGVGLWSRHIWPELAEHLGGPALIGLLHTAGAWLFAAFLLGHLYLITTGPRITSYFMAMLTGAEELPEQHLAERT
jgi:thiosulfate reductase cytochrome b subunit